MADVPSRWSVDPKQDPFSHEVVYILFAERSYFKLFFLLPLLSICTGLLLPLAMFWFPYLNLIFRFGTAHSLQRNNLKDEERFAKVQEIIRLIESGRITHVVIKNLSGDYVLTPVNREEASFMFMHIKYRYSGQIAIEKDVSGSIYYGYDQPWKLTHAYGFFPVVFNSNQPNSEIIATYKHGIQSKQQEEEQRALYGSAAIKIERPGLFYLFITELFTPF